MGSEANLRTRIAPTPSGYLHLGNAFSFILTWLIARKENGSVLLRIDDLDAQRKRSEFVEDIFETLDWLGLDYDEGPVGPDEFERVYSQRCRLDLYREALDRLGGDESLFACGCTRGTVRSASDGLHPSSCRARGLSREAENVAWRVATPVGAPVEWADADRASRSVDLHNSMRDFVVRRKDGLPAYQLASLVDDSHFGVNYIVRGEDLLDSTAAQFHLAKLLGEARFSDTSFVHHSILYADDGTKLSKSAGASSIRAMRGRDPTPEKLYQRLSPLLGLPTPAANAKQALAMWGG